MRNLCLLCTVNVQVPLPALFPQIFRIRFPVKKFGDAFANSYNNNYTPIAMIACDFVVDLK